MFTYLCGYLWHLTDWLAEGCTEWWLTDGSVDYVFVYLYILYLQNVIGIVCLLTYVDVSDMFDSSRPRQVIGELNSIHMLLRIIQEYDTISKK